MLHIGEERMPWQAQEIGSLGWVSDRQFLTELGVEIAKQEGNLRATVQKFYQKGLLTKTQSETIRPRLSIAVYDDRGRTRQPVAPLPQLQFSDSRTSYRVNPQP
jgi:hypothetical protein